MVHILQQTLRDGKMRGGFGKYVAWASETELITFVKTEAKLDLGRNLSVS